MRKIPFLLSIFLAAVLHADDSTPIKFGVITSLTGPVAEWGENTTRGMELARDEINAAGGVRGRTLALVYEDMADMDMRKAATAAQKLLQIDQVNALLTQWTEDTEIAWPIAVKKNVLTLTYAAGSSDITKGKDLLFRIWPSDDLLIKRVVQYAAKTDKRNPCIISQQSPYFESMRANAEAEWLRLGAKKPRMVEHGADVLDFRPYLLQFRDCSSILTLTDQALLPSLYKQLKISGTKAMLISFPGISAPSVREAAGSYVHSAVYAAYPLGTPEFIASYTAKFGKGPGLPAAAAYDAVKILAKAIEAKGLGAHQIAAGLKEIKDFPGVSGQVTFTPDGDRAPLEPQLWRISKGKVEAVS